MLAQTSTPQHQAQMSTSSSPPPIMRAETDSPRLAAIPTETVPRVSEQPGETSAMTLRGGGCVVRLLPTFFFFALA